MAGQLHALKESTRDLTDLTASQTGLIDSRSQNGEHDMANEISDEQVERLVVAFERYAAAQESLAAQPPALIENLGKRGGGGGGNWKKEGADHGLFPVKPDLTNIPDNDIFYLPVVSYRFDTKYNRLEFFSPFDSKLEVSAAGVKSATIDPAKKTFAEVFKTWKFNDTGAKLAFAGGAIRILKMKVGTMDGKKIASIAGVGAPPNGITDPLALTYATPEKAAQEFSEGKAGGVEP